MFAILAVVGFALALVFHLAGGSVAQYVLTAELSAFIALALHLAGAGGWVSSRRAS
jgi:hypothetical protein